MLGFGGVSTYAVSDPPRQSVFVYPSGPAGFLAALVYQASVGQAYAWQPSSVARVAQAQAEGAIMEAEFVAVQAIQAQADAVVSTASCVTGEASQAEAMKVEVRYG